MATKVKTSKVKKLTTNRFQVTSVGVNSNTVSIELPKDILRYLNVQNGKIYWAAVNGVIQISGAEPHIVIPMMTVTTDGFVAQRAPKIKN